MNSIMKEYERWKNNATHDIDIVKELNDICNNEKQISIKSLEVIQLNIIIYDTRQNHK